jgi:hypothetical protein
MPAASWRIGGRTTSGPDATERSATRRRPSTRHGRARQRRCRTSTDSRTVGPTTRLATTCLTPVCGHAWQGMAGPPRSVPVKVGHRLRVE